MLLNIKRTRELLAEKSIDVLVATSPMHVFYSSDVPTVMSMPNRIMFSVMSRNPWIASIIQKEAKEAIVCANAAAETVKATTWIENVKTYAALSTIERPKNARIDPIASSLMEGIAKVIGEFGAKDGRVAVEKSKLPLSAYVELQKLLPKATFGDADEIFVKLRSIKSAEEVSKIKRATEITQKAIQSAMDATREGVSELELLEVLKSTIFNEGGDWLHTTVSAGKYNSAAIYHAPTNYRLKKGDVLRLDLGAVYNGYASDLARVAVVGNPSRQGC